MYVNFRENSVLYLTDLNQNLFVLYDITDFRIIIGNQFVFDKKDKLTKNLKYFQK